jgi:hypothetical protein
MQTAKSAGSATPKRNSNSSFQKAFDYLEIMVYVSTHLEF